MKIRARVILAAAAVLCTVASYGQKRSGNPIFEGRYADPEGVVFGNTYWIYPTYSAPFDDQLFFDAFSSKDLVKWTKHERIIDSSRIKWLRRALWAPAAIEKDGKYYLFFGANDVHEGEIGGIGVAVADNPAGPFEDYLGKPLIGEIINGAQPIDQFVFKDKDGTLYMYYGGWRHCNVAKLRDDLRGFVPFDDGETFKEVTPEGYVEGPFMFIRDGKYYFMWSEGGWTGPDYRVAYAVSDNPLGPFVRKGVMHRNLFVCAPRVLDGFLRFNGREALYIAGQASGVEGYLESTAMGLAAAVFAYAQLAGEEMPEFPKETAVGSLLNYLKTALPESFQPMNVNLGIFPRLGKKKIRKRTERCEAYARRSLEALDKFIEERAALFRAQD